MYERINKLLDAVWSTLEMVGYAEGVLKTSVDEEVELFEKYGERCDELTARSHAIAERIIADAIAEYEKG